MVSEAIKKIEEEIKSVNNPYVKVIGEFLIKQLDVNPGAAEKILNQDKSIMNSLSAMRKLAEKKKVGNMAVLTDEEAFKIVSDYFEIENKAIKKPEEYNLKDNVEVKKQTTEDIKENDIDFDINLEDYI